MTSIRALRRSRGMTLVALALQSGIPARTLGALEYGLEGLDTQSRARLAAVFGVLPELLVTEVAPHSPSTINLQHVKALIVALTGTLFLTSLITHDALLPPTGRWGADAGRSIAAMTFPEGIADEAGRPRAPATVRDVARRPTPSQGAILSRLAASTPTRTPTPAPTLPRATAEPTFPAPTATPPVQIAAAAPTAAALVGEPSDTLPVVKPSLTAASPEPPDVEPAIAPPSPEPTLAVPPSELPPPEPTLAAPPPEPTLQAPEPTAPELPPEPPAPAPEPTLAAPPEPTLPAAAPEPTLTVPPPEPTLPAAGPEPTLAAPPVPSPSDPPPQPSAELASNGPRGCPLTGYQGRVVVTQGYGEGTHAPAAIWGALDLAVDSDGDGVGDPGATAGVSVVATHEGVAHVFPNSWPGGNFILVENSQVDWNTAYAHLASIAVADGEPVHAGTLLGTVGSTGWATGPHLHYEVRHAGSNQDPSPFLTCDE